MREKRDRPERRSAFALEYDPGRDCAPRLVAAGRGRVAERILEVAAANGVPVVEDSDLSEVLAGVELDCEIPPRLYAAVAELLVFVAGIHRRAKMSKW